MSLGKIITLGLIGLSTAALGGYAGSKLSIPSEDQKIRAQTILPSIQKEYNEADRAYELATTNKDVSPQSYDSLIDKRRDLSIKVGDLQRQINGERHPAGIPAGLILGFAAPFVAWYMKHMDDGMSVADP